MYTYRYKASLVAQLVKNLSTMWETRVWSLGREDPLEKGKATYSGLKNSMDCSPPGSSLYGISQARILKWAAFPFPGDLPDPGIKPTSPALQADYHWATSEAPLLSMSLRKGPIRDPGGSATSSGSSFIERQTPYWAETVGVEHDNMFQKTVS